MIKLGNFIVAVSVERNLSGKGKITSIIFLASLDGAQYSFTLQYSQIPVMTALNNPSALAT